VQRKNGERGGPSQWRGDAEDSLTIGSKNIFVFPKVKISAN